MALKYKMRALEDPSNNYVFWTSDIPDLTGTDAPVSIVSGTATILSVGGEVDTTAGGVDFYPSDASDLVQWKCNETAGPVINYGTAGSAGNLITESGILYGVRANPRSIHPCIQLSSSTSYLSTADGVVEPTGDITVSMYYFIFSHNSGNATFLKKCFLPIGGAAPLAALDLLVTNGNKGYVYVPNLGWIYYNISIPLFNWTHIGWSRSASTGQYKTYINGVNTITSTTLTGNINWAGTGYSGKSAGPWRVGYDGVTITSGMYIQDIRIANTIRDEAWFLAMYNHLIGTPVV